MIAHDVALLQRLLAQRTRDDELRLVLGLALLADTDEAYSDLCDLLASQGYLLVPEVDQLFACEWWAARVYEVDRSAYARQVLAGEGTA